MAPSRRIVTGLGPMAVCAGLLLGGPHPWAAELGYTNPWVGNSFGDQPKAEMVDRGVRLEFRAAPGEPRPARICGLTFVAPETSAYTVTGTARLRFWDGTGRVRLALIHKCLDAAIEVAAPRLEPGDHLPLADFTAAVGAGDKLVLVPIVDGAFTGGEVVLEDIQITRED